MVEEALSHLGGVTSLIRPGSTVVVKPNSLGSNLPPERGTTTSAAVLGAVIKELHKARPKEIIVAEGLRGDAPECYELCGQRKAAEDAGVDRMINVRTDKNLDLIKIPIRDRISTLEFFLLPRFLVEADYIVNVPVFKTHVCMVYTCALKNIKGLCQDQRRDCGVDQEEAWRGRHEGHQPYQEHPEDGRRGK